MQKEEIWRVSEKKGRKRIRKKNKRVIQRGVENWDTSTKYKWRRPISSYYDAGKIKARNWKHGIAS